MRVSVGQRVALKSCLEFGTAQVRNLLEGDRVNRESAGAKAYVIRKS